MSPAKKLNHCVTHNVVIHSCTLVITDDERSRSSKDNVKIKEKNYNPREIGNIDMEKMSSLLKFWTRPNKPTSFDSRGTKLDCFGQSPKEPYLSVQGESKLHYRPFCTTDIFLFDKECFEVLDIQSR